MPGVTSQVIPMEGYAHGEYGTAPSWDAGWRLLRQHLYYAGAFTARNVQRSLGGTLEQRSGLVEVPLTGVPNGKLTGFVWTDAPNRDLLFCVGATVYDAPSGSGGGAATAYTGTFAITPTVPVAFAPEANGIVWASVFGDKTYKIDQSARTVTAVTGSPGGSCIAIYGRRLMVGDVATAGNRIFFSGDDSLPPASEGDFTIWDPLNYLDIGDAWPVNALLPQRTALVVAKQKSWHLLTGVPGVNDVVRVLNQNGPWVQGPNLVSLSGDNTIWFVDFNRDTPNAFNGALMSEQEFLSFNGGTYAYTALPPTFGVGRGYRNHDMLFGAVTTPGGTMKAAFFQNGMWTFHTFTVPAGFQGAWVGFRDGHSAGYRFSDGGNTGAPAKFYGWVTNRDRPPVSGQPFEALGDAGGATLSPSVTFPEWWARDGEESQVRSVIVDFLRWHDGFGVNNHFEISVQSLNQYGDLTTPGTAGTPFSKTYDADPSAIGSVGDSKMARVFFNLDGELGNGWQLTLKNLVGVSIKKLQVVVDMSPRRGT